MRFCSSEPDTITSVLPAWPVSIKRDYFLQKQLDKDIPQIESNLGVLSATATLQ